MLSEPPLISPLADEDWDILDNRTVADAQQDSEISAPQITSAALSKQQLKQKEKAKKAEERLKQKQQSLCVKWEKLLLTRFEDLDKIKSLCLEGIPPSIRVRVWLRLISKNYPLTPGHMLVYLLTNWCRCLFYLY